MKTSCGIKSVACLLLIVISGIVPVVTSSQPLSWDSVFRVQVRINDTIQPDSLYILNSSGGNQVEIKNFMTLIGGSFFPFSHVFRLHGFMVQYGKFISYANLGFESGFASQQITGMEPPACNRFVNGDSVYFAPLGFLSAAIRGAVTFDEEAAILNITVSPPLVYGSIFPPAAAVKQELTASGYSVQQGEITKENPIAFCQAGYTSDANGNNADYPYYGIQLPPTDGVDSLFIVPSTYNLKEDEAMVFIGQTPPECKYFSYRSYLYNRLYNFPYSTSRTKINASMGDTKSLYRMREDLPLDSMFNRKIALIMTADSLIAMDIKSIILAATPEIAEADIHFDILPHDIFRFGIQPQSDWCNFLCRAVLFSDTAAQNQYMNNIPVEIMRVQANPASQRKFFSVHPFLPRADGTTEFSLLPGMYLLEENIHDAFNEDYEIILLESSAWTMEGFTAIQMGANALGDNHDALYIPTAHFQFRDQDIILIYGVDHTRTGKAVYTNIDIYGTKYNNGFGGISNAMAEKSARQFISDTSIADKYFAYTFTRHPIPGNPFVYIVPFDTNGTLEGINVNDTAEMASRLYVNTITKIGPDPLEVVLDRTVILRPLPSGISENNQLVPALKIYPNPFTDKAILEFSIPEWSDIHLEIYNNLGQKVGNSLLINHVRGTVVHELRVSGQIPPGRYYIRGQVIPLGNSPGYNLSSSLILLK